MADGLLHEMRSNFASGRIDRRQFIAAALAAGASLPAVLRMVGSAQAAAPQKGGHLTFGIAGGASTDTLLPGTLNDDGGRIVSWAYRNSLTEVDPSGNLKGDLAESWDVSADAKTWTIMLRKGIAFHSGKTLAAEDVVASMNIHRGGDSKSAAKALMDQVEDVKADGPDKVVFSLKTGNADFAVVLSDYNLLIVPSKDGKADTANKDGTGNYVLESFEPGVRAVLKRNANAWKGGRAHLDGAEIRYIADTTARMNALMSGEVHVINRADVKTLDMLKQVPGLKVEEVTGTQHYTLPMHCDTAPFADVNVRLALKYAIDRQELVDKILLGHGKVANDHPIAPANRYFANDIPQRAYDPDMARSLLKKAGMDKLKVQLSAANAAFGGAVDAAMLYQASAAKAGIEIEVVREPDDGYWDNVWLKKPWSMSYWTGRPTEDWMFSQAYAADAAWNESHWNSPRFNDLLVAARTELDEAKRRQMYGEMQLLCRDDGGSVIPMYANYVWATTAAVAHEEALAANWDLDGNRCVERWWSQA
jgi:peptide/nickel transport system substrate-binding protein